MQGMNMELNTYRKKSDILKAIGKSSDDTRYLDRAIDRGEIIMVNIDGLERYIIYDECVAFFVGNVIRRGDIISDTLSKGADNSEELEEAKANVEYYEQENSELKDRNVALESILDSLRDKGIDIGFGV